MAPPTAPDAAPCCAAFPSSVVAHPSRTKTAESAHMTTSSFFICWTPFLISFVTDRLCGLAARLSHEIAITRRTHRSNFHIGEKTGPTRPGVLFLGSGSLICTVPIIAACIFLRLVRRCCRSGPNRRQQVTEGSNQRKKGSKQDGNFIADFEIRQCRISGSDGDACQNKKDNWRIVRIRGLMSATQSVGPGSNRANDGRTRPPCWRADPALRRPGT